MRNTEENTSLLPGYGVDQTFRMQAIDDVWNDIMYNYSNLVLSRWEGSLVAPRLNPCTSVSMSRVRFIRARGLLGASKQCDGFTRLMTCFRSS